jgi:hypothetical protein
MPKIRVWSSIVVFFLMIFQGLAQGQISEKYDESGNLMFQEIIQVDTTLNVFIMSKKWFSESFSSGKAAIDFEDKESSQIIAKCKSKYPVFYKKKFLTDIDLFFTIKVEGKKGKTRITFSNIYTRGIEHPYHERSAEFWYGPLCKGCKKELNEYHKEQIKTSIQEVFSQYVQYVNKINSDF